MWRVVGILLVATLVILYRIEWPGSGGPFGLSSRTPDVLVQFNSAVGELVSTGSTTDEVQAKLAEAGFVCGASTLVLSSTVSLEADACLFVEEPPHPFLVRWMLTAIGAPANSNWLVLLQHPVQPQSHNAYAVQHDQTWLQPPMPMSQLYFSMESAWCEMAKVSDTKFDCDWTHASFTYPKEWVGSRLWRSHPVRPS